jgi:hypothetical protein
VDLVNDLVSPGAVTPAVTHSPITKQSFLHLINNLCMKFAIAAYISGLGLGSLAISEPIIKQTNDNVVFIDFEGQTGLIDNNLLLIRKKKQLTITEITPKETQRKLKIAKRSTKNMWEKISKANK